MTTTLNDERPNSLGESQVQPLSYLPIPGDEFGNLKSASTGNLPVLPYWPAHGAKNVAGTYSRGTR